MKRIMIVTALLAAMCACTSEPDARRALEGAGYRDIQFHGYGWFGCGQDDTYATKFTATGPTGNKVSGVVCAGLVLKGQTIRTD